MSEITAVTLGERQVLVKREDLLHPFVSGNKFRKLKYNLLLALENGASGIISFGGAFSNHIHALSYACQFYNIPLTLFIRGEDVQNPTLDFVRSTGAKLQFVSRTEYRELKNASSFDDFPRAVVIPEGGSNELAIKGISEMMVELNAQLEKLQNISSSSSSFQYCVSYGSGGTSIGIMSVLEAEDHLHIFSSLKMKDLQHDFLKRCEFLGVEPKENVTLYDNYHFGGFAKFNDDLISFINGFEIPLDPLYTGKMFYAINDLIKQDRFDKRQIVAIHTGGLQGIAGFNHRFGGILVDRSSDRE